MTSGEFSNESAIITGAGQGIGFAIAKQLCLKGASVMVNDIDSKRAHDAVARITAAGCGNCVAYPGDASDVSTIESMVAEAVKQFSKVTIAIANAGITVFSNFFDYTPQQLQGVLDLNIRGSFFLVQAAAKAMRGNADGGSILLLSSATGHRAHENLAAYGMSKGALEILARTLVPHLSRFKISINAVAPGATLTERTIEDLRYAEMWSHVTPMGKVATVDDIANAAIFLVSRSSRHITGQSLVVDGGWTSVIQHHI